MTERTEPIVDREHLILRTITVRMPGTMHRRVRELCLRVSAQSGVVLSMNEFCVVAIERAFESFDGKANGAPRPLPNQTEMFDGGSKK